ncbi:FAD-dependent oxidoreductase [Treponema sp. OttesenSCG-928-L16]|nr:FAD-dependent oxidoreductase [Treponema sp. OttesenSCG-928-L16]
MISYIKNDIPAIGSYDVIVCGSGPSGICAAVSSARMGKSTLLLERQGMVGGALTSMLVGPTMGRVCKGTMTDEINALLGGDPSIKMAFDIEEAKIKLTELLAAANVKVYLQAQIADVFMENNTITGLLIASPDGLKAVYGKVIIDATGDGTVSHFAGADFETGRESDKLMQPVSLMFRLYGIDETKVLKKENWTYDIRMPNTPEAKRFLEFCVAASKTGALPEAVSLVRLYRTSRPGECHVNATHKNYINGTKLEDIGSAEIELRKQIPIIRDFLKKSVPGFENCFVQNSAVTLGVRDTRRIIGDYVLTHEDLLSGRKFEDVIVHNAWFYMDIHNITGGGQTLTDVLPYDIPYRCLVPLKIEQLLTTGRCISGTHKAEASYRIMNICMATGQAAGIAAALAAEKNISPRKLNYQEVQKVLTSLGIDLFE